MTRTPNKTMRAFPGAFGLAHNGMTLRDYFATHCPDSWLKEATPTTIGGMRDALIERKIIPASRAQTVDVLRSYEERDERQLLVALRWEYADAMLAEREK